MKLTIGENIRNFRKKNDLTQEAFADRLGVTYQSVSRWENGTTYPDLELLPAISEILSVTVDELLGMPRIEKERRALEVFDELRRECMKQDYDSGRIVTLLRDIRINHIKSEHAWRPWCEGNGRAFRDPKILPEVRLFADAYLQRHPMAPHVIQTMAEIEEEEHLHAFIDKYTTSFDCSARALLYNRYLTRGDVERFEIERRYRLYKAFNDLLHPRNYIKWGEEKSENDSVDEFMENMLSFIRQDAVDERPDMWTSDRIELGFKSAARLLSFGKQDEAIRQIEKTVRLLEDVMSITDELLLPTSCRFLYGMEWYAEDGWHSPFNDPDNQERMILVQTDMNDCRFCYCIFPSLELHRLQSEDFKALHDHFEFQKLCERVKALIVTKTNE